MMLLVFSNFHTLNKKKSFRCFSPLKYNECTFIYPSRSLLKSPSVFALIISPTHCMHLFLIKLFCTCSRVIFLIMNILAAGAAPVFQSVFTRTDSAALWSQKSIWFKWRGGKNWTFFFPIYRNSDAPVSTCIIFSVQQVIFAADCTAFTTEK